MSWYRMERGWQDHPFFSDEKYTEREAWEWLISHTAFKPHIVKVKGNPIRLNRGQLSYSIRFLAEAWQWNKGKTERFIKKLKKWSMIETATGTGQIIITICEYSKYQDGKEENGTAVGETPGQERDRSGTNNKKDKEGKEGVRGARAKKQKKGTRIDPDWQLPEDWGNWAVGEGMQTDQVLVEEEKFRDYWLARAGPQGVKLDWQATWRNWIRRAMEQKL